MSGITDPVQALFQAGALASTDLPPNSRHHGVARRSLVRADGTVVPYLARRIIPPAGAFAPVAKHLVVQGDRLDRIAAAALGDPELAWRLCDANGVLRPEELEVPGRRLRITMPAGVPGAGR